MLTAEPLARARPRSMGVGALNAAAPRPQSTRPIRISRSSPSSSPIRAAADAGLRRRRLDDRRTVGPGLGERGLGLGRVGLRGLVERGLGVGCVGIGGLGVGGLGVRGMGLGCVGEQFRRTTCDRKAATRFAGTDRLRAVSGERGDGEPCGALRRRLGGEPC